MKIEVYYTFDYQTLNHPKAGLWMSGWLFWESSSRSWSCDQLLQDILC